MTTPIKKKSNNIFTWWRIDFDEVETQINQYNTLSLFKASRKVSALCLILSFVITIIFVILKLAPPAYLIDSAILLTLSGFVFSGKKWALFIAMVYWTLSKVFGIIGAPIQAFAQIIWWCAYMKVFYMAYVVEEKRAKPKTVGDATL